MTVTGVSLMPCGSAVEKQIEYSVYVLLQSRRYCVGHLAQMVHFYSLQLFSFGVITATRSVPSLPRVPIEQKIMYRSAWQYEQRIRSKSPRTIEVHNRHCNNYIRAGCFVSSHSQGDRTLSLDILDNPSVHARLNLQRPLYLSGQ